MASPPEPIPSLKRTKKYDPSVYGSCVVFFVRDDDLMYVGATDNLPYYVALMERKADQYGWSWTDIYYVPAPVKMMDSVAKALVSHFKPIMNANRPRSASDRRILKALGLITL